jgi:hypothetical protein
MYGVLWYMQHSQYFDHEENSRHVKHPQLSLMRDFFSGNYWSLRFSDFCKMVQALGRLQLLGPEVKKYFTYFIGKLAKGNIELKLRDVNAFFDGIASSKHFVYDPFVKKIAGEYENLP